MTWALDTALLAVVAAYGWRWRGARHALSMVRLAAFVAGMVALWAAVASPIANLDRGHLTGHMIQHLLIMTIAAPLLLLGEPMYVFRSPVTRDQRPARWPALHPVVCWLAGTLVVLIWHVPGIFEVGMRWHGLQHATFLAAGLLFWVPVLRPWPTVSSWPRWSVPLYLLLATLPCDALSAFLAFCNRIVYSRYSSMPVDCPMNGGISALEDQQRAGALMWFWVTIAYLVPAALVTIELLSPRRQSFANSTTTERASAR
jgi:cytochrome c oxidase assembly factor CtaG